MNYIPTYLKQYIFSRFIKILKKLADHAESSSLGNILKDLSDKAYFIENLHEELFKKVKPAADVYLKEEEKGKQSYSGDNVADIFVEMRAQFLMYAPFIVHCENVEKLIGLMKIDASVSKDIRNLESFLNDEIERTGKKNIPSSFNSLLAFPFQHVIR